VLLITFARQALINYENMKFCFSLSFLVSVNLLTGLPYFLMLINFSKLLRLDAMRQSNRLHYGLTIKIKLEVLRPLLWSPYVIGQTIIFLPCSFFLSSFFLLFFPRLISAVGDWMFTILWHMVWP